MNNRTPNSPDKKVGIPTNRRDKHQTNTNHQILPLMRDPVIQKILCGTNTKRSKFGKLVIGRWLLFGYCCLVIGVFPLFAQDDTLELTLDVSATNTIPLPQIFKPNIDLSGRGFHRMQTWPQCLAAEEVLALWDKEIGFNGMYRLQYNLWEVQQLAKAKDAQASLLLNYENIIKKITDAGGIVILDIFGTPAGLGKVLDKKSPAINLKAFKELLKSNIRTLSCDKRYNIWYELWSAPDLDDFFLGRQQEYFNLYRLAAEAVKELEQETKIHIPLGGPASSWWFQNLDGNTIVTAERSLVYALIKFCSQNKLPLNFITWHAYSSDPKAEKEVTIYNKAAIALIRDWLGYFNFDRDTPLIIDEWNYDLGVNVAPERKEKSHICASYALSRLKNMYEAGIDYQLYFSLEDFQDNKEGVTRNTGLFDKGRPKSAYNVFRMLAKLGDKMLVMPKSGDEFTGALATKTQDAIAMLIYNYIDPEIFRNYLSRNIAGLNPAERKALLNLIKTDNLGKIIQHQLDILQLRLSKKTKALLIKARELNDQAVKFSASARNIKIMIKSLSGSYLYQRYAVDSSCSAECAFAPVEEKEVNVMDLYEETLALNPYSANLIILKEKPKEPESAVTPETAPQPVS